MVKKKWEYYRDGYTKLTDIFESSIEVTGRNYLQVLSAVSKTPIILKHELANYLNVNTA